MLYCSFCGYEVDPASTDTKVLDDIRDWVALMLKLKGRKPGASDEFNVEHVPCPGCGKTRGWSERAG